MHCLLVQIIFTAVSGCLCTQHSLMIGWKYELKLLYDNTIKSPPFTSGTQQRSSDPCCLASSSLVSSSSFPFNFLILLFTLLILKSAIRLNREGPHIDGRKQNKFRSGLHCQGSHHKYNVLSPCTLFFVPWCIFLLEMIM